MLSAFAVLLVFQCLGEGLVFLFGWPVPGPVTVDALYAQAVAAWSADDVEGASRVLDQALAIDNNLPALLYLSGCIALKRQQYPAAVEAFGRCLDGAPGFPLSLMQQAVTRPLLVLVVPTWMECLYTRSGFVA